MQITPSLAIDEGDITEEFLRSTGPGGQNVNKVATAVRLRYDLARSSLPADVKSRVAALAGAKMTDEGVLVIEAREHRTQAKNREAARERLRDLLQRALRRPRARKPSTPTTASRERRLEAKARRSRVKRARRDEGD